MGKLWQKGTESLDKNIEEFEVGDDYLLDMHLAPFDVYGSAAHAIMLEKIGILSKVELNAILSGLKTILNEIETSQFTISLKDEDVHTRVENLLVERIGDAGKRLHTARSRNDQILVDTRLYTKYQIIQLALNIVDCCQKILIFAQQYEFVPMPGYTHMQLAMPSSVGMWASSFVENFLDELYLLSANYNYVNMNPLGSGAGYGVSLDIDRVFTTCLLGFERVQKNPIYCGNSRGRVEANVLSLISSFGLILNRIASDLLLFTTKEFGFFKINPTITTGSSIMPQKKNLDVMELIRGRTHTLIAYETQVKNLITNLPSGYNRDYQESKRCLIYSFHLITQMLKVTQVVFGSIEPIEENLLKAHKPELYATDAAYRLVKQGMPFRDAYRQVGQNLDQLASEDPVENIKSKTHLGATGNIGLMEYQQRLSTIKQNWEEKKNTYMSILSKLFDEKREQSCK